MQDRGFVGVGSACGVCHKPNSILDDVFASDLSGSAFLMLIRLFAKRYP
jgi:hypothetical protein